VTEWRVSPPVRVALKHDQEFLSPLDYLNKTSMKRMQPHARLPIANCQLNSPGNPRLAINIGEAVVFTRTESKRDVILVEL
jgi:hypothetical protein